MKKIFILLLAVLTIQQGAMAEYYLDNILKETKYNVKYSPVDILERNYEAGDYELKIPAGIIDPKLIKLTSYKEIDDKDFKAKKDKDEIIYNNIKKSTFNRSQTEVDYYHIYRISERLLRANNLDFVNWKIAVRKTQDINASASTGFYITINTGLYDTIYQNEDALAYVLAHEMSHQILGHRKRKEVMALEMQTLDRDMALAARRGDAVRTFAYLKLLEKSYKKYRMMEYMADAEAVRLIMSAGYSPYKAIEMLNIFETYSNDFTLNSDTHPDPKARIENFKDSILVADPNWIKKGRENLYNSPVLPTKVASDRVSIVFERSDAKKDFYHTETRRERLTRMAYMLYIQGYFDKAEDYFNKLISMDKKDAKKAKKEADDNNLYDFEDYDNDNISANNDFIPYVYLSALNECKYNKLKDKKYLKKAKSYIQKAFEINPSNSAVLDQKIRLDKKAL